MSGDSTPIELYGPDDGGWFTTRVHDWIGLCEDLRDADVRGYLVLRALVVEKYKNPVRKLTLATLCKLIPGPNKKPSSVTRVRGILDALSKAGLVSTPEGGPIKTSSRANAAHRPIRIRINDMPPGAYGGWRNAEAKLAFLNQEAAEAGAGRNSDPGSAEGASEEGAGRNSDPAGCNSDPRGLNSDPDSGPDLPERDLPLGPSVGTRPAGDALSARSAGDGRRPSDRSSAREVESGCAASSNDHPSPEPQTPRQKAKTSSSKAKHTRQQLDLVRAVRAHFPADMLSGWAHPQTGQVLEALPDVPALSQAILEALAGDVPAADRTVDQLGARIVQRWNHHGWAQKFYAGEIGSLVGAAVAMVRPLKAGDRYGCANPRCEAGADVDTGEECHVCPERLAARQVARRAEQAQEVVDGPQAEVPAQRPSGGFLRPRTCPCGDPIDMTAEDPLCPSCREDADDAEETARLRAKLAAQYGTPDQVEAYTYGRAPF
jgi:hypothetical protein